MYQYEHILEQLPGGHEICNFDKPFLDHHCYTHVHSLSDLCMGVEKQIFLKEVMYFHFINYMAMP